MIKRQLFPDKYHDVPKDVLANAAARGTNIHQLIELSDKGFPSDDVPEIESYKRIKEEHKLITIANEYIVTDGEHFASGIDLLMAHDKRSKTVFIVDTKTTYTLDREYVRWQLSIYAKWFEKQNPHLKVGGIFALWLRGDKSEFTELDRIDAPIVQALLDAEVKGEQFKNPLSVNNYPVQITKAEKMIADLNKKLEVLENQKKKLIDGLLPIMVENNIKSFKGSLISLTRKDAYEKESFDSKKFKEDHPDMYSEYIKTSKVKESLTLKVL